VCTAEEEHGGDRKLIRVRYRIRPSGYSKLLGLFGLTALGLAGIFQAWPLAVVGALSLAGVGGAWWRGCRRASQAVVLVDKLARDMGLSRT
jgi:hypothetical protein